MSKEKMKEKETENPVSATVPVLEEKLRVDKEVVETGERVVLQKKVNEKEVIVDVPVKHDHVTIERIRINRPVDTAPPAIRYEGDTMIVSVLEEEIIVRKQLVLVEELHITRQIEESRRQEEITLRKEDIQIRTQNND